MKKLLQKVIFIAAVVTLSLAVSKAQTHQISVTSNVIEPSQLTVGPTDTIEFIWPGNSSSTHPIVSDDNSSFASPSNVTSYKVFAKNLTPGSYPFHCTIHQSMKGTINVTISAGLSDLREVKYELQVSPNPFEDELNVTIFPGNRNVKAIKIFDIIGKEVASIDLSAKNGPSAYKVDFSNLRPGLYFCNVYSDKGIIETRKIFRNRS